MKIKAMKLKDLQIVGGISPKMVKAAAALSHMHDLFDAETRIVPGASKGSCIMSALTARDLMWKLGWKDAAIMPVYLRVEGWHGDKGLWSVGVGDHDTFHAHHSRPGFKPLVDRTTGPGWNGHAVVISPAANVLIDPTIGQCRRDQWPTLPEMLVVELLPDTPSPNLMPSHAPIIGFDWVEHQDVPETRADRVRVHYTAQPFNTRWRDAPDAERTRRAPVVADMRKMFAAWKEAA